MGIPYIESDGSLKFQGTGASVAGILCDNLGNVPFVPSRYLFNGITGSQQINITTATTIGSLMFDPSALFLGNTKITRTIKFRTIVQCTPGVTLEIRLYNITDGAVVTNSILTTNSSSPIELTATLTTPSDLPNSLKMYYVQLRITSPATPGTTDRAICQSANIVVDYT